MILRLFFLYFFFGGWPLAFPSLLAQPANNECQDAILLTDLEDWCSANAAFTNVNADVSGFGPASCFSNAGGGDVWFRFVATATDVVIVVEGATNVAPGGTLLGPEIALYLGNCSGVINEQECEADAGNNNIVDLYKGGLSIGESYLVRVKSRPDNLGTFQLCINNFNPPVFPGSDCVTSAVLCDRTGFTIPQVIGAGNLPDEANGSCLGFGGNSESNSTWFSWIAANNGTLTLELQPLNETDDLDFIIFELPNGIDNCNNKEELRCMAAGEFEAAFPSPCLGVTGLATGETDISEAAGCTENQSNFLAPLVLEQGKAYAMMVNNFSGSGSGFNVSFGGDAEFLGPEPSMLINPQLVCVGETVEFVNNSTFSLGTINSWEWSFGVGATPATATGIGPHTVTYEVDGFKSVALTIGTADGCQVTEVNSTLMVDNCCQTLNAINVSETITDLECLTIPTGAIDLQINSNSSITSINWNNGSTTPNISDLFTGLYEVSITNALGCDTSFTYEVGAPAALTTVADITMPACAGGMDGSVVLNTTGGIMPYQYAWQNGNTTNTITNIGVNIYNVTISDAAGCELILAVDVRELELQLNSGMPVVTPPLCFDSNEGAVVFDVTNGTPPYEFNYNDGNGFVGDNMFTGLNSGIFNVQFRDASGCVGDTIVEVVPPAPLDLTLSPVPISCFMADDGMASVMVMGGVGDYTYLWNDANATTDTVVTELTPGLATVTVTDGNNCTMESSVNIIEPAGLFVNVTGVENVLCFGDSTGSVSVAGSGGIAGYSYSLDSMNFSVDSILLDVAAGTFPVYVMDTEGCIATTEATISEPEELIVDAGRDTTVNLGFPARISSFVLPFQRPVAISWLPMDVLDCSDCPSTTLLPLETDIYTITVVDSTGCTATDSVMVRVNKNRPIYIPNAFSPNFDGNNDIFTAYGNPGAQQIKLMRIFNRWGALIYEGENLPLNSNTMGWNGVFKNEQMQPGVYVYYIVVDFIDGVSVGYEGDITILR